MCAICAPTNPNLTTKCFITAFDAAKTFIPAQVTPRVLRKKGIKVHVYEQCGNTFCWASELKRHKKSHGTQKVHYCKGCRANFKYETTCKRHELGCEKLLLTTECPKKMYHCEFCECTFKRHDALLRHKRTHTGEKPYCCQFCEGRFPDFYRWKRHEAKCKAKSTPNAQAD